jgi:membrane-bound lytic murein transglycosylase B
MGVALLGERLAGRPGVQRAWPRNEPTLDASQRREVQDRLAALGYYSGRIDGMFGTMTREAVRSFQLNRGLTADGYVNMALLATLRRTQ